MPTTPRTRKNLRLDQRKLDRARRILRARTETETVERALDLVAFREEAISGLRRVAGTKAVRPLRRA
jgi:hypothetical protein